MRFLVYFLHRHNDFRCVLVVLVRVVRVSLHFFTFLLRGGCASRGFTLAAMTLFVT